MPSPRDITIEMKGERGMEGGRDEGLKEGGEEGRENRDSVSIVMTLAMDSVTKI